MNKLISKFAFLLLLMLFSTLAYGQNKIEKSSLKKTIDGVEYYMHTVQQGQTAYAISKAYSISAEDIYKSNPGSDSKIEIGQVLLIPVKPLPVTTTETNIKAENKKDSVKQVVNNQTFNTHIVQAGETLYRICQLYKVKDSVLIFHNPGIENGLKLGQEIKIPSQYKMQLVSEDYAEKKAQIAENIDKKSITEAQIEPSTTNCKALKTNKTIKVAVMMPFYTHLDNIDTDNPLLVEQADKYKVFQFIQYYEGFLIAADSLAKLGMKIDLTVFDTKADSLTVKELVRKTDFTEFDMIFGPFFTYNQKIVLNAVKNSKTFVVNPFSKDMNLVNGNSKMFKLEPEYTTQVYNMAKWVKDSMPSANILIIHNAKEDELNNVAELKKNFGLAGVKAEQIRVFSYKEGGLDKLFKSFQKDKQNIVINVVNNEATITSFIRMLNNYTKTYDITVLGSENRWEKFTTLEKEYLSNLKLLQFSTTFINYERPDVQHFVGVFANKYGTDPKEMAFQGFDHAYYFLQLYKLYGENFTACMENSNINTMSTVFEFKRNSANDCWQNSFENIYQYQNLKLVDKKRIVPNVTIIKE